MSWPESTYVSPGFMHDRFGVRAVDCCQLGPLVVRSACGHLASRALTIGREEPWEMEPDKFIIQSYSPMTVFFVEYEAFLGGLP